MSFVRRANSIFVAWFVLGALFLIVARHAVALLEGIPRVLTVIPTGQDPIDQAISPDERLLAVLDRDGSLTLIEVQNKVVLADIALPPSAGGTSPKSVAFTGDSGYVVVTFVNGELLVLDAVSRSLVGRRPSVAPVLLDSVALPNGVISVDPFLGIFTVIRAPSGDEVPIHFAGGALEAYAVAARSNPVEEESGTRLTLAYKLAESSHVEIVEATLPSLASGDTLRVATELRLGDIRTEVENGQVVGYFLALYDERTGDASVVNVDMVGRIVRQRDFLGERGTMLVSFDASGLVTIGSETCLVTYVPDLTEFLDWTKTESNFHLGGYRDLEMRSLKVYPGELGSFAVVTAPNPESQAFSFSSYAGVFVFDYQPGYLESSNSCGNNNNSNNDENCNEPLPLTQVLTRSAYLPMCRDEFGNVDCGKPASYFQGVECDPSTPEGCCVSDHGDCGYDSGAAGGDPPKYYSWIPEKKCFVGCIQKYPGQDFASYITADDYAEVYLDGCRIFFKAQCCGQGLVDKYHDGQTTSGQDWDDGLCPVDLGLDDLICDNEKHTLRIVYRNDQNDGPPSGPIPSPCSPGAGQAAHDGMTLWLGNSWNVESGGVEIWWEDEGCELMSDQCMDEQVDRYVFIEETKQIKVKLLQDSATIKIEREAGSAKGDAKFIKKNGSTIPETNEVTLTGKGSEHTLTLEGKEVSDAENNLEIDTPCGKLKFTVVGVEKVEWDEGSNSNLSEDNPSANGDGWRIFPGANTSGGNKNDKVKARATIKPTKDDVDVYFAVIDADDPTASTSPIDNDSGSPGPDNHGGLGTLDAESGATDGNGQVEVELTVTMRPGDNFRIVAAGSEDALDGLEAKQPDLTGRVEDSDSNIVNEFSVDPNPARRKASPHLVVWRKLHLELDSMPNGAGQNGAWTANIDDVTNNKYHAADGACELNDFEENDDGRFEGGTLDVSATGRTYTVIDNVDVAVDDDVVTDGAINALDEDKEAHLKDDDDMSVLPRTVDTGYFQSRFSRAFIEAEVVESATPVSSTFFTHVEESAAGILAAGNAAKDLTSSVNYWVATILSAHQGKQIGEVGGVSIVDADPDRKYHKHGAIWHEIGSNGFILGITVTVGRNLNVICLETIRDMAGQIAEGQFEGSPPNYTAANIERITVVHEVGHQFGLSHKPGTLMQLGNADPDQYFDDAQYLELRTLTNIESEQQ